ncbi:TorD/DmsD family molecular chaperone [Paenibacillus ihumii]|uniref:TorD/DmsD family molecular chaperone n=1 Tax=Paenibacillus ihumii TaxID=687436 RepID=UPI0006D7A066|nr:molecular chaperone TorD family protein [Paenibacillus ihumii]
MSMLFKEPVQASPEQIVWLERRGWVYELLMDFLSRPPRMSLIAQWRQRAEATDRIPNSRGGKRLRSYLESIPEHQFRSVCHLEAEEYRRLFMGDRGLLIPWEGTFRAKRDGANAAACISHIRSMYADSGVVFNKLSGERDDHIAMELEFMAVMAEGMRSRADLEHMRSSCLELADAQIRFLEIHLLKWAPRLAEEMIRATETPLYSGLAELLREFLHQDLEQLRKWKADIS